MININKLFKDSWQIYIKQFKTLVLITILTFLPIAIFQILAGFYKNNFVLENFSGSGIEFGLIALIVLAIFISWVGKGALIKNINDNKGIRKSLDYAWHNLASIVWIDILTSIIVIIGFILFIIPGILFSIWYAFSLMVLILENKKGWQALKQSRELTQGKWWGIFERLAILYIIIIVVNILLSRADSLINGSQILTDVVFTVIMVLFTPFIFAYTYTIYKSLKGGAKNE
ncbi:MAG: hypothetical protein UR15_C0006G0007 [Parcubacteria group bacterium GW2011_GWA2_31_28]|nr:MAG: hypothetical protein UR15_C0006G0007 [Parcubacteria group bacterium GW2011_GWA2_31_28]